MARYELYLEGRNALRTRLIVHHEFDDVDPDDIKHVLGWTFKDAIWLFLKDRKSVV